MNPEWAELPAVVEIIKNRFSRALKRRQRHFRVRANELVLGRSEKIDRGDAVPNKITHDEFELGDEERLFYSPETGMIVYIQTNGRANLEKREIDPRSGVVMHHLKRFGGNAVDESRDDYYSLIEYTRDPNEPRVHYRTVYKNISMENSDIQESKAVEYDYGYPLELEKNGVPHKKTPIYFIKRYPRYEEWFQRRFKSKDEYVQRVFLMQKNSMNRLWKDYRRVLEQNIVDYAKAKDKLDAYYSGLQEIFATSIIGPVFKVFITGKIQTIIEDDELHMFYETGSKEAMLQQIQSRLTQEVESKPLEDVIRKEGEKVIARIGENPDYQVAKETFSGDARTIEEDYSMEDALLDIHDQSNLVEDFHQETNPFQIERDRLEKKIQFIHNQIKILRTAYRAFPRRRKNLSKTLEEIESRQIKKKVLPSVPPEPKGEGR